MSEKLQGSSRKSGVSEKLQDGLEQGRYGAGMRLRATARAQTEDLHFTRVALYQLSYGGGTPLWTAPAQV